MSDRCKTKLFHRTALLVASIAIFLPNLGYSLIQPDESRYAQIALTMVESGNWTTPILDDQPYLDKPPLMYWFTAISFLMFGENEIAARLPAAISAVLTVWIAYILGCRLVGHFAAWLGAISLLLSGGFVLAGRFLILDSLLTFFTTLGFIAGYAAIRETSLKPGWWILLGFACGLGILTKGPVALVICVPPLLLCEYLTHGFRRLKWGGWSICGVTTCAISIPWFVLAAKMNPSFLEYFFWEHNLNRFAAGSNHSQPFPFYIPIVFASMFPASLLIPSVIYYLRSRFHGLKHGEDDGLRLLCISATWILLFFSLSTCKLATYILPAIPLICLMIGTMLEQTVFRLDAKSAIGGYLRPYPQRATLIVIFASLVVVATNAWMSQRLSPSSMFAVVVCMVIVVITVRCWNCPIAFSQRGWLFHTAVAVLSISFAAGTLVPTIADSRSLHKKAIEFASKQAGAEIIFFGDKPHAIQMRLPLEQFTYIPSTEKVRFIEYIKDLGDVVIVSDSLNIAATEQEILKTHTISPSTVHNRIRFAKRNSGEARQVASRINSGPL